MRSLLSTSVPPELHLKAGLSSELQTNQFVGLEVAGPDGREISAVVDFHMAHVHPQGRDPIGGSSAR